MIKDPGALEEAVFCRAVLSLSSAKQKELQQLQ